MNVCTAALSLSRMASAKNFGCARYSDCTAIVSAVGYIKVSGSDLVDLSIYASSTQDCVAPGDKRRRALGAPSTWTVLMYLVAE
jgi:hypothetical protein